MEVKEFNDGFHVSHFMREELDDSLVASYFAHPIDDLKQVRDILWYIVGVPPSLGFLDVDLEVSHYRGNDSIHYGIQDSRLLLILLHLTTTHG